MLAEYNASSLAAIVVLTDGVTTDGESLTHASDAARDQGVPLFFVGIGDANEMHNLRLHDLQAVDSVYVNDHIIFELTLTAPAILARPCRSRSRKRARTRSWTSRT